jgi:hypothetical protein
MGDEDAAWGGGWGEVTKHTLCLAGSLAPTAHYYRATKRQRTDASLEHKKYKIVPSAQTMVLVCGRQHTLPH